MKAAIEVGDERLVSARGTIIPEAVNLGDDRILACYSIGLDAWFGASGASLSTDGGRTWQETEPPLPRMESMGEVGDGHAIFFDQYLWRLGDGFTALYNETMDGGRSFSGVRQATFELRDALLTVYRPAAPGAPDAWFRPPIPDCYDDLVGDGEAQVGGYIFGRVLRLPDGALGVSAYCQLRGNMKRVIGAGGNPHEVSASPDAGIAAEAQEDVLFSVVFFRSEDGGRSWRQAGIVGQMQPGEPFDGGMLYSEGFTEAGISVTADGRLYALMRHGSYMLLWRNTSADGGRTWDDLMCFNYPGVAPALCLLPSGILAAAWGRPGMTVGFSLDGTGHNWEVMAGIMQDDQKSQKYPWLTPLDDHRLLLLYDRRQWDARAHRFYDHGIYCRDICIRI